MRAALVIAAVVMSTSSLALAGNNGGKNDSAPDRETTGSLKGNGLNIDGTSDDAAKCRERTAGAALCGQRPKNGER
jgi:hypothetical protein